MKQHIVENQVQTTRNLITVLNAILKNTEFWTVNFIQYGIKTKPPYPGSHLVYNTDLNCYQFWAPNKTELSNLNVTNLHNFQYKHRTCIKQTDWIYFPLGYPYVVLLDDTSWILDLYHSFSYKPEHIGPQSALYGNKLYNYIQSTATLERGALKNVLVNLENKNKINKTKELF